MDFPVIPKPPTKGDERENYRWQYLVCELLNGFRTVVLAHNDTVGVAIVDVTGTDNVEPKHVTNAQGKKWEEHVDIVNGNPHGVAPKNLGGYTLVNTSVNCNATVGDFINADATAGVITVTPPSGSNGKEFYVRKVDASANVVTIAGLKDIAYQFTAIRFIYNGTTWSAA